MILTETLRKFFGYETFRPAQLEIIGEIISSKNVLAVLPTGAGKSICYQIPAIIGDNYSIIISPLIALMKDQVDSINRHHEIAAFINSSLSYLETEKILNDIKFGKLKLVYIAPERLENIEFAKRLSALNPEYLFVDEAHCISEWGHNFRPSYTRIKDFIEYSKIKKISAFTATATPEVVKDIIKQLGLKNVKTIIKGFERDNLFVNVEIIKKKNERCLELIRQYKSPVIIYTSSRKKAEDLTNFLKMHKINCDYYHAGLNSIIRKKIQEDFIDEKLPVIIATNAFGMGIDKKNIRLVIHYNLPGSIENYYQEIGRAGRDGKGSNTFLLFDDSDVHIHEFFISNSYPNKEIIKKVYNAICDFGQVAIGMKPDKDIQINPDYIKLHSKLDISSSLLNSSLKFLSEADYIKINSAFNSGIKVRLLFNQSRLKKFIKETPNEYMRNILLSIVRNYGNEIFSKQIKIDLKKIGNNTGFTIEEIESTLINLENLSILEYIKTGGKESVSFTAPRVRSDELKLNYKLINELYISSKQKLNKIVDYIYINDCRFKYILNYFGEEVSQYSCGKCDNCLKENPNEEIALSFVMQKIKELLLDHQDGVTEKDIIEILTGKSKDPGFHKSISFCSLPNHTKENIVEAIKHLLIEKEILEERISGKKRYFVSGENPSIVNEKVFYTVEKEPNDLELFHLLRQAREKTSKKFLQSPNIICTDEVLSRISREKPLNKNEMMKIKGFNERMFNKIGNDFLEVISTYVENTKGRQEIEIPKNIIETYKLLQKKYSLDEIAGLRKLTDSVISMQIETILKYLPETDISSIIPDEKLELVRVKYKEGKTGLKELRDSLSGAYSYQVLRIALAKLSNQV